MEDLLRHSHMMGNPGRFSQARNRRAPSASLPVPTVRLQAFLDAGTLSLSTHAECDTLYFNSGIPYCLGSLRGCHAHNAAPALTSISPKPKLRPHRTPQCNSTLEYAQRRTSIIPVGYVQGSGGMHVLLHAVCTPSSHVSARLNFARSRDRISCFVAHLYPVRRATVSSPSV